MEEKSVVGRFDSSALAENRAVRADRADERSSDIVGCGGTLPDQEIVIADPKTLKKCNDGQVGEIWVRGPSIAQGYWRNPQSTAETFQATLSDTGEGPFLRTGDLGVVDGGELFVTGRIKDLIINHGVNVYPQDVEHTIQESHAGLRANSGAVFVAQVDGHERLVAVQELERRAKGDSDEVLDAIRRSVSREHELALDAIVLVKTGSVPKTSSGKIQRHACRQGYLDGTLVVLAEWPEGEGQNPQSEALHTTQAPAASGETASLAPAEKSRSEEDAPPNVVSIMTPVVLVTPKAKPSVELRRSTSGPAFDRDAEEIGENDRQAAIAAELPAE
jgi:acyl-CoA synthetase (AMP-forming)/AMP-acid ligase II